MRSLSFGVMAALLAVVVVAAGQTPAAPGGGGRAGGAPAAQAPTDPTVVGRTPEGFTLRLARTTNHISNYNESVVPSYTLPDPLVTFDGRPVRTAVDWKARRAEFVTAYEDESHRVHAGWCGASRAADSAGELRGRAAARRGGRCHAWGGGWSARSWTRPWQRRPRRATRGG